MLFIVMQLRLNGIVEQMKTQLITWLKGSRGEWYVIAQVALCILVVFGPRSVQVLPVWEGVLSVITTVAGAVLLFVGAVFSGTGLLLHGPGISPLPDPKEGVEFIEKGPYRIVRHPIYSGLIFMAFGWGLWIHGILTLFYALLLSVLFDFKTRREERMLLERYPAYKEYRERVRKLLPFVY